MRFSQLRGNEDVVKALAGMVETGRVPHALLFHEDDGGGAFALCVAFLQLLHCENASQDSCGNCPSCNKIGKLIHPDVHIIFPTEAGKTSIQYITAFRKLFEENPDFTEMELYKAIGLEAKNSLIAVNEAKQLLDDLSLTALEGGYRSVIIYLPEKMNAEAANRLLKIIEEPPLKTQFLLIVHRTERLLATISSRCQYIRLRPATLRKTSGCAEPEIFDELMGALLARNLLTCIEIGERLAALPSREDAKAFCRFAAEQFRQIFLFQQGLSSLLAEDADKEKIGAWAKACPKTFSRGALGVMDRSCLLVDRNVNLKLLFTDMADRLYTLI